MPDADPVAWLEREVSGLEPDEKTPHWGAKPGPRCARHPEAPTKTTTVRTVVCAACEAEGHETILERTVTGTQYHDADGRPLTPGEVSRMLGGKSS